MSSVVAELKEENVYRPKVPKDSFQSVKKKKCFVRIMTEGTSAYSDNFKIFSVIHQLDTSVRLDSDQSVEHFLHYGLTVSRKVGNAVKRNRVKRVLREILRGLFKENYWSYSCELVILTRPTIVALTYHELRAQLIDALRRVEKKHFKRLQLHVV